MTGCEGEEKAWRCGIDSNIVVIVGGTIRVGGGVTFTEGPAGIGQVVGISRYEESAAEVFEALERQWTRQNGGREGVQVFYFVTSLPC